MVGRGPLSWGRSISTRHWGQRENRAYTVEGNYKKVLRGPGEYPYSTMVENYSYLVKYNKFVVGNNLPHKFVQQYY